MSKHLSMLSLFVIQFYYSNPRREKNVFIMLYQQKHLNASQNKRRLFFYMRDSMYVRDVPEALTDK